MTQFVTSPGPFLRNPLAETKRAMRDYTIGLLGLFAFSTGFHWLTHGMVYGIKAIGMMVTSLVITLLADMLVAALRYQSKDGRMGPYMIHAVKKNYSYVTAVLMTLTLPIGTPYFVVIVGNLFATLIVKYTFGGFGMNLFNPAAFGRIFVGVAFSSQLTAFIPGANGVYLGDVPSLTVTGQTITTAFASAYPNWIAGNLNGLPITSLWQLILGNYSGALGETSVLLIVILGSILTILKAHNWRPTVFFLFTLWFGAFVLGLSHGINPLWYAFTFVSLGSAFFGGMFMLTDPVTSPTSNFGKAMIGIIAGIVVLIIRTQTSLPEGMVYGIAVANLASPIIDKYTVGLTNQFLKQRYALLSGMMVLAISVTVLPTFATSEISSPSPSSSEPVVIPYATYRGTYTSYFYDEQDEPIELIVDVGVDRSFNLVKIDFIQGISTSGYAPTWQAGGQAILNAYLAMDVATLLSLNPLDMPNNLVITGSSITTNRLLRALQNAFDGVQVLNGSATSYAYDEANTPDTTNATVYIDENDVVIGLALTGKLATSQPYLGIVEEKITSIQDYYLGMNAMDILALGNQGPVYPDFNPVGTGATISFNRIYQAIREAIGTAYGS